MEREQQDRSQLLSRNELIQWLYTFLNSELIQHLDIKITTKNLHQRSYYCFRCTIVEEFITEMSRKVKAEVKSNIHDAFLVFIAYYLIQSDPRFLSQKDADGIWKDAIKDAVRYEQKTGVGIMRPKFGSFFGRFFHAIIEEEESKDVWWFVTLYKIDSTKIEQEPKNIKYPLCSYYLVCTSLESKSLKIPLNESPKSEQQKLKEIEEEINEDQELFLREVEKEDGFIEGILIPVNNTIVMDKMRTENKELNDKVEQLNLVASSVMAENEELKGFVSTLKRENEFLKTENSSFKSEIDQLRTENSSFKSEIDQLKNEIELMKKEFKILPH